MILVNPNFNEFKNDCKKRTFKKLTIEKIILKNTVWESHWSESQTKYFFCPKSNKFENIWVFSARSMRNF